MPSTWFSARSGFGLGLVLMLAVAPLGAGPVRAETKPVAETVITAAEREEFRVGVRATGETMSLLMDAYPDEYLALETKVIVGVKSGQLDMSAIRQMSFEWATNLRGRMMANVAKAPDADLLAVGRLQLEVMRKLGPSNARACYEFVEQGGLSQDSAINLGGETRAQVDRLGALQLRAASAGMKAPVTRAKIGEAEITPILEAFQQKGGDIRWMAAVGDSAKLAEFSAEERCAGAQRWIETVLDQPASLSARLLAE